MCTEFLGYEDGTKVPKTEKKPTTGFSISIYSTPNQNHPSPLIPDTFQVMGNTPVDVVIWWV